jgi:hypothetical protein
LLTFPYEAPNFKAKPHMATSISMNFWVTSGVFCSRIPRTSLQFAPQS